MTSKLRYLFFEWVIPVVAAVIITLLVQHFFLFMVTVPTGSMNPTIMEGDRLLVTRVYNLERALHHGDVVVFDSAELNKLLIKRLIGLPGDHIEIEEDGTLYINGELFEEPYVKNPSRSGIKKTFDVPEGHYFFLGDNRANSNDARMWKQPYIAASEVKAKAQFTLWPLNRIKVVQ